LARTTDAASYLTELQNAPQKAFSALLPAVGTDAQIHHTWNLSLNTLESRGVSGARALLAVLSWYAPATGIPLALVFHENVVIGSQELQAREHAMNALHDVGLVDVDRSESDEDQDPHWRRRVSVHPLICEAFRVHRASGDGSTPSALRSAISWLSEVIKPLAPDDPGDWSKWAALAPHILEFVQRGAEDLDDAGLSQVISIAADVAAALGESDQNDARLIDTTVLVSSRLGQLHPQALRSRQRQAIALRRENGDLAAADEQLSRTLAEQRDLLGEVHPDVLLTWDSLLDTWMTQGRLTEAEAGYRTLTDIQRRELGAEDLRTQQTVIDHAWCLMDLGQATVAHTMLVDAVRTLTTSVGPDHPTTLDARHDLARSLAESGQFADAEQAFVDVLRDQRRVVGDNHRLTRTTEDSLAALRHRRP
jgi:hypothetical protein